MIILDTNVLSALMWTEPDRLVVDWLDRQPWTSVWTTSITLLEIRFGLYSLPTGRRRSQLISAFQKVVLEKMEQRIAPFDADAAQQAAELMVVRKKTRRPGDLRDTMIAGIVLARGATLATRNTRHFADLAVPVIDPWASQ